MTKKERQRAWYRRNSKQKMAEVKARKVKLRAWFKSLKATLQCERCGENHPACLDFHHRDPTTKEFELGSVLRLGYSFERIWAEIEKCDVLCANCHRKETFGDY